MINTQTKRKNLRRTYLVNPQLQFGVTGLFCFLATLNVGAVYFGYKVLIRTLFQEMSILDARSQQFLSEALTQQSSVLEKSILFFCIFILAYHLLLGFVLFHHIAGPAYAIKKQLSRLVKGENPPKVILRKYDFFRDVVDELNALTAKLDPTRKEVEDSHNH